MMIIKLCLFFFYKIWRSNIVCTKLLRSLCKNCSLLSGVIRIDGTIMFRPAHILSFIFCVCYNDKFKTIQNIVYNMLLNGFLFGYSRLKDFCFCIVCNHPEII